MLGESNKSRGDCRVMTEAAVDDTNVNNVHIDVAREQHELQAQGRVVESTRVSQNYPV